MQLLRQHLPLMLANSDRILRTPRYFFCQLGRSYLSSVWVFGGGGPIPLGVLLLLWNAGELLFDCPRCGNSFHAVGISGSILSGCGSAWGPCINCNEQQSFRLDHMGETILAVGPLLRVHRNEAIIERSKQPRFDWKDGLVGESIPDRVIVPAITPASLPTLIAELTGSCLDNPPVEGRPTEDSGQPPFTPSPLPRNTRLPFPLQKKRRSS